MKPENQPSCPSAIRSSCVRLISPVFIADYFPFSQGAESSHLWSRQVPWLGCQKLFTSQHVTQATPGGMNWSVTCFLLEEIKENFLFLLVWCRIHQDTTGPCLSFVDGYYHFTSLFTCVPPGVWVVLNCLSQELIQFIWALRLWSNTYNIPVQFFYSP